MADKDKQKDDTGETAGDRAEKAGPDKPSRAASARESAVPGVKRPPHTIDLKADEVKEDKSAGKASAEAEKKGRKAEGTAAASAAKPGEKPAGKTGGKAESASRASASARKEPPQRTSPSQVTGFVTHLAAGLLGGVAGVIGAGYFLPGVGGVPQEYRESVDGRIATLESRLSAAEGRGASDTEIQAIGKRTADIEQRLDASARAWDTLKDAPAAMRERLDRLEATLKAMEETAAKGGDVAQTAAIRSQVVEMTGAMDTRIAALRGDLDALSQRLAALSAGTGEAANAEQTSRVEALRRDLDALRTRAESAGAAGGDGAALAIRLTALLRAAERGEPFAAQLDALRTAAPEGVDLSALDAWAGAGVPSLVALQRRFPAARKAALDAAPRAEGGESLVDRFLDSASSVVRIRRVDGGDASGPDAALARMEDRLREGDLQGAVGEAESLPEARRAALGPWLGQARDRIALDAALADASDALARRLAAGGRSR